MSISPSNKSFDFKAAVSDGAAAGHKRSVLIADDHEDTRLMLRTILEMNHFSVLEAADGQTAVWLTEVAHPDIVLMDYTLPIVDGLTALRRIKANKAVRDVPVIFLSGRAEPAPQKAAREAGCTDYLVKPVSLSRVIELIEHQLSAKSKLAKAS